MSASARGILLGVDGTAALVRLATELEARRLRVGRDVVVRDLGDGVEPFNAPPVVVIGPNMDAHELAGLVHHRPLEAMNVYMARHPGEMARVGVLVEVVVRDELPADVTSGGDMFRRYAAGTLVVEGRFLWRG